MNTMLDRSNLKGSRMETKALVSPDAIRADFSAAMSAMYRTEVPAYGTLISLVGEVNASFLAADPQLREALDLSDSLERISEERHGAIRLGRPDELSMMRRALAVMGMHAVGYYDLSEAGVPVHSTAFRPIDGVALSVNPFRLFTSLLRLDLIADEALRAEAQRILSSREIFTTGAVALIEKAEAAGGLDARDARSFIAELLETFRWHSEALVDEASYRRLHAGHRLLADVASFRGPHINHLTPRTLDIDAVQRLMPGRGIAPKATVEGPPTRRCPILLRQTSFKALEEPISFVAGDGERKEGSHTARFGEIEQRGIALTPQGRDLYDRLLAEVLSKCRPAADGSNASTYEAALEMAFRKFPDSWEEIRRKRLGYFTYHIRDPRMAGMMRMSGAAFDDMVDAGAVSATPIVYEDFLPVSAAGIFQSNLGDRSAGSYSASPNQRLFEAALGAPVLDEFEHYAQLERSSVTRCLREMKAAA